MGTKCTAYFNPQGEVWLRRESPRDPTRRVGIAKEAAMEGDARSTTHPIQQLIATEAEANSAFDDITYKKGQSFLRMLESFLGEDVFRDGIRRYIAAHKYSNSTTADLWNALSEASKKPVGEIAAGWTEQPGFPLVRVKREAEGKVRLTQERFAVNFKNAPPLQWKIPLTYSLVGEAPATLLMTSKIGNLQNIPADRALKLNVNGAGNYRVEYDEPSWNLLLEALPKLGVEDRVDLLSDAWALVQPDLRPPVLAVVGRYADEKTWTKLHELGLKTTSIEEKQNYYNALAEAVDPKLVKKTLPIALTDELPTSRAIFLVAGVARDSGHPDIAWEFAKANMKALLAKSDAVGVNRFAPSLFTFFPDDLRADELKSYAKDNLPSASAPEVAKAVDEIQFRAEFKKRLATQLRAWVGDKGL